MARGISRELNSENTPIISVVSPVYMAAELVDVLVKQVTSELEKITDNYELILVEDGSVDNSWQQIEQKCQELQKVKGIKLSRNFGQHYALTAGLKEATGDYVVVIDCDHHSGVVPQGSGRP